MGDVANCKLGYFTQWNDAEHSTADNASSVPYYLQCHITRTYPIGLFILLLRSDLLGYLSTVAATCYFTESLKCALYEN